MSKHKLRKETINKMKQFSDQDQKLSADQYLTQQLMNTSEYKSAYRIGVVLSMQHEVDTYPIISKILNDDKKYLYQKLIIKTKQCHLRS